MPVTGIFLSGEKKKKNERRKEDCKYIVKKKVELEPTDHIYIKKRLSRNSM